MKIIFRSGFNHNTVVVRAGVHVLARRTNVTSPDHASDAKDQVRQTAAACVDVDVPPNTPLRIEVLGGQIFPRLMELLPDCLHSDFIELDLGTPVQLCG